MPSDSTPKPADQGVARPGARGLRLLLLVVVPLVAAGIGAWIWIGGGRWVTTDNAYVGAQKVLITPEVSGRIVSISVAEGAVVHRGDVLVAVDPEPYRIALTEEEAKLAATRAEHADLVATAASLERQIDLARETAELRRIDLDRKSALVATRSASQSDVDTARITAVAARNVVEQLEQTRRTTLARLLGRADLPVAEFPAYAEAEAALARARRNLAETEIRAPLDGIATQVASIQMGRYVNAGDAIFAVVGTARIWIDANPKETDLGHVTAGDPVEVIVDTFPDRKIRGRVAAISPGTGSQFSILPAQNASGNWVKVVQRVPVRIEFAAEEDVSGLRSGMSAWVAIDTGHVRSLSDLVGLLPSFGRGDRAAVATAHAVAPSGH
jgi:membrane fusion protein (multidrug efflux system)